MQKAEKYSNTHPLTAVMIVMADDNKQTQKATAVFNYEDYDHDS